MPAANAMHSFFAKIFVANFDQGNPGAPLPGAGWTELAEVISINGVPMNSTVTRVTHLSSPGKAHEKIPGFLDAGQVTFRFNFSSGKANGLWALLPDENSFNPDYGRWDWVVQFPDNSQWYFQGFIQGMPHDVPEDDRVTMEVTIEISGYPTFNNLG